MRLVSRFMILPRVTLRRATALAMTSAMMCLTLPEAAAQNGWLPASWFSSEAVDADAMYPLAEKDGPWLVLATTFRGETARDDAKKLAHELRGRHKLAAYTHEKAFDYTGRQRGVGLNPDGTPKTMRYANAKQVIEVAVLVGDFASCEDQRGQKTLQKIKTLHPESLGGKPPKSGLVADFMQLNKEHAAPATKPPLHAAMLIPNPLLPDDFFSRQQIDQFVRFGLLNGDCQRRVCVCRKHRSHDEARQQQDDHEGPQSHGVHLSRGPHHCPL